MNGLLAGAMVFALLLSGCGSTESAEPQPADAAHSELESITLVLPNEHLDANRLTQGLPLRDRKITKSGSGLDKQTWGFKGLDDFQGSIETTGNDQSDLVNIGGRCAEFTKDGAMQWPWPAESKCRKIFVTLLGNVVDQPDKLADYLISHAQKQTPRAAVVEYGDISVELDARTFFFIRRISLTGNP